MTRRYPQALTQGFALAAVTAACLNAAAQTSPPANPNEPVQPQPALAGASSGSAASIGALTTQSPYYIGIQQALTHERTKLAPGGSSSDTFSTTTLRAGVNQPISRQRFFADAEVRVARYADRTASNNVGYGLNAGVDWATINRLSGTLSAHADRTRTPFIESGGFFPTSDGSVTSPVANAVVPVDNITRSEELRGVGRLGVTTPLTLELGASYRQVSFSKAEGENYKRRGANVAGIYRLSSATNVGLGLSTAKSKYNDDNADRRDVYVQGQWIPSSLTDFQARLGRTTVDYDVRNGRDFSGITGSLAWNWRPTARIAVTTTIARDTGQDIGFLRIAPGTPISAANVSVASNTLNVRATYEATAKILVDGGIGWSKRYLANPYLVNTFSGVSDGTSVSLGSRWMFTRNVSLGCQVQFEQVSTKTKQIIAPSQAIQTGTTKLNNDQFGCFGSFTIY
jgi:hypothetical protein